MERTDPLTGEKFIPKRNNQKFATRSNQVRFNNKKARERRELKSEINKTLDKNRAILEQLHDNQPHVLHSKDFLLGAGYHFGCFTHSIKVDDRLIRCVFDLGIEKVGNKFKVQKYDR